ncbi:MAG: hydantoinase/oxoprolinase family protein [Armatimonadota bacterium]
MGTYRIGIDVGGTFTHAIALEARSLELVGQSKVPTTHRSDRGVAEGVVQALRRLLADARIAPSEISFLAYSTTQVTNALLEGDVEPVGILAVGAGFEGRRAAGQTRVGDLSLAPGRSLRTIHHYLDAERFTDQEIDRSLASFRDAGAAAVVAAEAFSVDDPRREQAIMARAAVLGLPATGTHEITARYGLRMRTRTAVINASLLPRAIATADLTEQAAAEIGITAPLMVVRSDGGVMSVADMRRRPLLTLLSGPAAGVAAALMYARVSEGIFLEVGGTSTDISAIRHGRALLRTAEVGGHRLFMRTVDVRTIGVAGGSMPRLSDGRINAVGPRSAHLAGLAYACFTPAQANPGGKVALVSPMLGDPADYAVLDTPQGDRLAITLTCAANAAGKVPRGDWAYGDQGAARAALAALGDFIRLSPEAAAQAMLDTAAQAPASVVEDLLVSRGIERAGAELIAGGGGASALVPAAGERLGLRVRVAPNASVISAIGTALALVREVVERTVPGATEQDVLRIRAEAVEAVVRQGADPDTVSVDIEYDARSALLRATASGQTELRERDLAQTAITDEERAAAAAKSLGAPLELVEVAAEVGLLRAYRAERTRKRLLGLLTDRRRSVAVVDEQGIVRLVLAGGEATAFQAAQVRDKLPALLEARTRYGDAGAELPQLFLCLRGRVVNLSGLVDQAQVLSLAEAELAAIARDETVLAVIAPRGA